ncbi:Uncharacterised protein r2_g4208 [Pycnogonum litorale]
MPILKNVTDLRRFMGMVNQMGKFSAKLTELSTPLRPLLSKNNVWCWEKMQNDAFQDIKDELSRSPVLKLYHPKHETIVSADASSFGLGAVLLQQKPGDSDFRPVYYASRSMSPAEQHYAQVEKEALAIT